MEVAIRNKDTDCQASSNLTLGTIIPPVQTASLNTNGTFAFKYGRVEVRARMPTGAWLAPSIKLLPRDNFYGAWPASGEIDVFQSKGNIPTSRAEKFSDTMRSILHWGTVKDMDMAFKDNGIFQLFRNWFNQDYYTLGLDWDENGITTWVNNPTKKVMNVNFKNPAIERYVWGTNGASSNVWSTSSTNAAPFDQDFFLQRDVAAGGTDGWFSSSGQPWSNGDPNAATSFWGSRASWQKTWPSDPTQRGMAIDSVRVYQQCSKK